MLNSRMRALITRKAALWFNETCNIVTDTINIGSMGNQVVTEVPYKLNVPCRRTRAGSAARASAGLVAEQTTFTSMYVLSVPIETGISINQKVVIDGLKYNVLATLEELTDKVFEEVLIGRQE